MDLGANRVPGTDALEIVRVKRTFGKCYGEFLEIRDELIKQSNPPSERGWPDGEAPQELMEALMELANEIQEVELTPLQLEKLVALDIAVEPDNLGLLLDLGVIEEKAELKAVDGDGVAPVEAA